MSKSRSGAPRRAAAGLLAGALAVVGLAFAPPAGAVDDVTTDRAAGATRYGTSAAVAGQPDFDGATTAILATGENFPDALAASGLAGDNAPAPIVLTESNNFTDETRVALSELGSLDDVIIVGGTSAVSEDVAAAVAEEGYEVSRLAGETRYSTAAAIANDVGTPGDIDGLNTALIASGEVFADALAGGPVAYAGNLSILLVNSDGVPAETAAAIEDNDIQQAILLGGTARISDDTAAELAELTGNDAVRVAGQDRFETATLIAEFAEAEFGWGPEEVLLANGLNFPDALSGGPLGGERQAPIVLTASIPEATAAYLDKISDTLRRILALGGTAAISDEDLASAEASGETTENDTPTGGDITTSGLQGPELVSVDVSGIDLDELAISYTFTFDTELDEDTLNPELFKLYNADTRSPALGDTFNAGEDMEVDGEDAVVVFNLAEYGVADATLGAVEEGAVEDEAGNPNPAQSLAAAGVSNGSSATLLSARVVDEDDGIIELEYSSPQVPGSTVANVYKLITKEGHVFTGTEADALEGAVNEVDADTYPDDDEPSTKVRVQFLCNGDDLPAQYSDDETDDNNEDDDPCKDADDDEGADLSDENLRRISVEATVLGSTRVQVANLASGGTTDAPDLVGLQTASDNEDLDDNEALFLFDEDIDTVGTTPGAIGAFDLVYSHCNPTPGVVLNDDILDALDLADDAAENYEDQDGQGFEDEINSPGSCQLSPTSVELANDADEDFSERAVLATFAEEDIDNDFLKAAQVRDEALVSEENGTGTLTNQDGEVELGGDQPASLWDDGEVAGPQLINATVEVDTSFGGDFDAWVLTLTFDKDIDNVALAGAVTFFYDDGENVESEDLAGCEVDDDTTIVCEVDDEDSDFANGTVVSVEDGTVVTDDTFTISDAEANVQFPNPEGSIEIDVPDAPDSEDA